MLRETRPRLRWHVLLPLLFALAGCVAGPAKKGTPLSGATVNAKPLTVHLSARREWGVLTLPASYLVDLRDIPEAPEEGRNAKVRLADGLWEITFTTIPSEDPTFLLQRLEPVESNQDLQALYGHELTILPNGDFLLNEFYSMPFTATRLFRLVDGKLKEVPQPYLRVGLECPLDDDTLIYSMPCDSGEVIASLPAGNSVQAVMAVENTCPARSERDVIRSSFLVTTTHGLTGWVTSTGGHGDSIGEPLTCLDEIGH